MDQFAGKFAVITGAGSGIGRALAQRCASEGMNVALADMHPGRLELLGNALSAEGAKVHTCTLDVADPAAVQDFATTCHVQFGAPDLLFNNAGILRVGEAWSHSFDDWQTILNVNVMGVVNGLNAFLPLMLAANKPGHIVNTGSVGSLVAAPGMAQYTAAKMAVRGISECLMHDLIGQAAPIDVSLLCPGPVLTSIGDELMGLEVSANVADASDHVMAGQPDFITPEQCADSVFSAIEQRKFWIFTHPFSRYLDEMSQAIVQGRNPEYVEVQFDANAEKDGHA